jgi:hypothetical protein
MICGSVRLRKASESQLSSGHEEQNSNVGRSSILLRSQNRSVGSPTQGFATVFVLFGYNCNILLHKKVQELCDLADTCVVEREVKKANRELQNQTSKMDPMAKVETLTKRCSDLFAEMTRLQRDNMKNKKRADQLQKEKDHGRTELSKTVTLREKLEKLCRELQRENNRLKVCAPLFGLLDIRFDLKEQVDLVQNYG